MVRWRLICSDTAIFVLAEFALCLPIFSDFYGKRLDLKILSCKVSDDPLLTVKV